VDNPEVDSKNASINEGIVPLIMYGKAPSNEKITHDRVTARNPSLLLNFAESASLEMKPKIAEERSVTAADQKKGEGDSL